MGKIADRMRRVRITFTFCVLDNRAMVNALIAWVFGGEEREGMRGGRVRNRLIPNRDVIVDVWVLVKICFRGCQFAAISVSQFLAYVT